MSGLRAWASGQCCHGHDITDPANVRTRPNGARDCRPCRRETDSARNARRRGAGPTSNSVVDPEDFSMPDSDVSLLERQRPVEPPSAAVQYLEDAFDAAYAHYQRRQVTGP